MIWLGLIAAAYLVGSVPFSFLVVRALRGIDVRSVGSGNPGATNAMRAVGALPALAVLALDFGKGLAPVAVGSWLGASPAVLAAAGVAAVAGHVFPLFLGFSGGKGVATAAGALAMLAPLAAAASMAVFFVAVAWKRYVSLGSILAVALAPAFVALFGRVGWSPRAPKELVAGVLLIGLLVLARHAENVRRLLAGAEHRLGERVGMEHW